MSKAKKLAITATIFTMAAAGTALAAENGWVQENGQWRYRVNGGYAEDTWKQSAGKYFYLDNNGNMLTNGLVEYDGDHYGTDADGRRLENEWRLFENDDGEEYWYFFQSSGKAKKNGFHTIDGNKYHFDDDGHMDTGWYVDDKDNIYFLNDTDEGVYGAATVGWKYVSSFDEDDDVDIEDEGWYYFDSNGKMLSDKEKKIGNYYYAFNEDGLMCDCWVNFANGDKGDDYYKFYRPGNGDRMNGWVFVEDCNAEDNGRDTEEGWFYLKNGRPYDTNYKTTIIADGIGAAKINGKYYAFDETGKMVTGKVTAEDGAYFYFEEKDGSTEGQMKTGKLNLKESDDLDEDTYYFEDNGSIGYRGRSITGVKKGYLYDNGVIVKAEDGMKWEVKTVDGDEYLVNESGKIKTSGSAKDDNGVKYEVSKNSDGTYHIEVIN